MTFIKVTLSVIAASHSSVTHGCVDHKFLFLGLDLTPSVVDGKPPLFHNMTLHFQFLYCFADTEAQGREQLDQGGYNSSTRP